MTAKADIKPLRESKEPLCSSIRPRIALSQKRKNIIPSKNPLAAGIAAGMPRFSASSIDGMSKLHIEAATITPAESPSIARRQEEPTPLPIKNTHAAPSAVPMKGINIPNKTSL